MQHQLIEATDGVLLPAFYYADSASFQTKSLALFIHGAGSSSIVRMPVFLNMLAEQLTVHSCDLLAFNNRGAGYITKFDTTSGASYLGGMAYEKISDFSLDLNGALDWAKNNGYTKIHLIGHSTGANKIVSYGILHGFSTAISSLVLIGGGDDIALQQSRYDKKQLSNAQKKAANEIAHGNARKLVPADYFAGNHPISWQSLEELITKNSDYDMFPFSELNQEFGFEKIKNIESIPTICIYGSNDFGTILPVPDALKRFDTMPVSTQLITDAEHDVKGYEEKYVTAITNFIAGIVGTYNGKRNSI